MSRSVSAWQRWWHTPADPRLAALLRVGLALVVLVATASQAAHVVTLWGETGLLPWDLAASVGHPTSPSVFRLLPAVDAVAWMAWGALVVQATLLLLGWHARVQAACVFGWLCSLDARNPALTDGGDALLRLLCFFLMFLPIEQVASLDARRRRHQGLPAPAPHSGWALRFMQLEVVLVLLVAGIEKLRGPTWWDGTAMYYVMHLDDLFATHLVPQAVRDSVGVSRLLTWSALAMELVVPFTVWWSRTRRASLLLVTAFHLCLALTMHLFVFEAVMLVGWAAFLRWDEDLAWVRRRGRPGDTATSTIPAPTAL